MMASSSMMTGALLSNSSPTWATAAAAQHNHQHLVRLLATTTSNNAKKNKNKPSSQQQSLIEAEEEFSAITDKIPQRPVSVVEGTSYTLVIIAALGFAAAVVYATLNTLLFKPKEYKCYNQTVERLKDDPRVTVRLGTPLAAYGVESRNRAARQTIPHRIYNDAEGREHIQIQFHLKGPSGRATVNADMYQDGSDWRYQFLYLDVEAPVRQQVVIVRPGQVDEY
jgi:import inner membrane translocase subunit TIM21